MIKFLRNLLKRLSGKEVVHFTPHYDMELKVSDGDRAALYGWPDRTIEEVMTHE